MVNGKINGESKEYYENGNFKCGDDFKIQPFGGWTLGLKEKSLRIIADSNIGPKSIKIDHFTPDLI